MKILIVQTGFIGDIILSTPLISVLQDYYPQAEISFLTTPIGAPLIEHNPQIREVIIFDKRGGDSGFTGLFNKAKELRKRRFDCVFSLHKSGRTSLLLFLARIKERYGFKQASLSFLYHKTVQRSDLGHEVLRNVAIVRACDLNPKSIQAKLHVTLSHEAEERAKVLLESSNGKFLVGIAPGSVWVTKRWPAKHFATLIKFLAQQNSFVVLLGSEGDLAIADEISKHAPNAAVLNLIGKTDLLTSAAVISKLQVVITNDSAPLHLASAFKVPTIALFCATVPQFGFGPWQTSSRVVGLENLWCRPCRRHGSNLCPSGSWLCMQALSPEFVKEALLELMAENGLAFKNQEAAIGMG